MFKFRSIPFKAQQEKIAKLTAAIASKSSPALRREPSIVEGTLILFQVDVQRSSIGIPISGSNNPRPYTTTLGLN